jgi:hypothetical protein
MPQNVYNVARQKVACLLLDLSTFFLKFNARENLGCIAALESGEHYSMQFCRAAPFVISGTEVSELVT